MPSKVQCYVPGCRSGIPSEKPNGHLSFFKFPRDEKRLKEWTRNIRRDKEPNKHDRVCSKHFADRFFKRQCIKAQDNGGKQQRATLTNDAVATIFPGYPSYLADLPTPRKPPRKRFLEK
ncbi:hypothetical protein RvY_10696 [Ramazzottius varieornatus]|uniref:THAP-type domain-containing protein n=1 Tax=Ramazzottius varieornatus TaxID=947166 RepID=A0A1D1VFN3_RAMVA|nr:hypothetical protein RvY_10696 [Ramazzottius varieornatus]